MLSFAPSLFAFTLDLAAYSGQSIPAPITVSVAGYGTVTFSAATPVTIGELYGATAVQFAPGQQLYVKFNGAPVDASVGSINLGLDGGEYFAQTFNAGNNAASFTLTGVGTVAGAGITGINFSVTPVPEASTSLLGLLGAAGFIIRRRR